jgi:hypothetical protein
LSNAQVEPPTIDMHLPDEVGDLLAVADVEQGASRDARAGSGQLHPETFGSLILDVGEPVPLGFHHPRTEATSQGRSTCQTQTRPSQAELVGRVAVSMSRRSEDEGVWRCPTTRW